MDNANNNSSSSADIQEIKQDLKEITVKVNEMDKSLSHVLYKFEQHREYEEQYYDEMRKISDILSRNTASLELHMKRSDALEALLQKQENKVAPLELDFQVRQKNKETIVYLSKVASLIVAILAIGASIVAWIKGLK